ncbi:MAG: hypothetical protein RI906_2608 [Pseudomonadota bacterium]|jgi:2-dehydro-3-deoxygalactonokinase
MNHPSAMESSACLIGLDWGTSSLRAYLFTANGQVIDQRSAPQGILSVTDGQFAQTWQALCAPWLAQTTTLPVIASGMIGSRQGWREAAYLPTPAGFDELGHTLTVLDDLAGRVFRIVPGLSHRNGSLPDVMRGEETQVAGLLAKAGTPGGIAAPAAHTDRLRIVLPGTHSKWVQVKQARIVAFRSYMTGEVYAVMQKHSILGRTSAEPSAQDETELGAYWRAFDAAVRLAASQPQSLLALFFSTRSKGLFGELNAIEQSGWLSGLTIGCELSAELGEHAGADSAPDSHHRESIIIVGSRELARRYERALHLLGRAAQIADGEPAASGLFAIAQRARLIA